MSTAPAYLLPSLEEWVERLSVEEMPIMYRTALDIASLAANEEAPTAALANAILKDPGLTARVLNLANSAFHSNSTNAQFLSTVSRAIVVLGSNAIRSICLSVTLVDSLLKGHAREQLLRELAKSFHAAVVAKALAIEQKDESPEEVFIAALLYRLGDLAFWCFGGELRDELEHRLDEGGKPEDSERSVVGFAFRDLTSALVKKWKLGSLPEQALRLSTHERTRAHLVTLSQQYVEAIHFGKDHPERPRIEAEFGKLLGLTPQSVQKLLEACGKEAADTARLCGAGPAASKIARLFIDEAPRGSFVAAVSKAHTETVPFTDFDPLLQLKILRELTTLVSSTGDLNSILETVLEGMYRSIGMDRAIFALVGGEPKHLTAKFAIGHDVDSLKEKFHLPMIDEEPHIFYTALEQRTILWAKVGNPAGSPGFIQRKVKQLVGTGPFFVAPAIMNGKAIGLFYVDRRISCRPRDEESFQSFKHFAQHANIGLEFLSRRSKDK